MGMATPAGRPSPVTQTEKGWRIQGGIQRMLAYRKDRHAGKDQEHVVYTGSWHDSIPRRLILDPLLNPTEKLVWQVIRTHIGQPGEDGAWPSISRLARLVRVSRPTIQNAIDVLQATRWLHAVRRVRDEHGNVIGNYYLLHALPLPVSETMLLAPDYLAMLRRMAQQAGPSKKRVSEVATLVLKRLMRRSEDGDDDLLAGIRRNLNENAMPPKTGLVPLLDAASRVDQTLVQSEPPEGVNVQYTWPDALRGMEKHAEAILRAAPSSLRQPLLDALAGASNVRNPLGYLARLVERARKGLFVDVEAQERKRSKEIKALSDALEAARTALAAGRRVTIRGHVIEDIVAGLVKRRGGDGYAQAFAIGIRPEDIEIQEE
ncbi:helix-turn-helix domain-containing protein [Mariprofundus ferrooxydans]|uniref:helix-turn-helix domain-containing protein n=1 Tax=Mariprofundus ferrooxydans TaxID=314344 RepID=UPI0009D75D0B|nr:helix-turn-helix domain-containing protein [Mariprofundus ferrooxydans]